MRIFSLQTIEFYPNLQVNTLDWLSPKAQWTPMQCCQCRGMVGWLVVSCLKKEDASFEESGCPRPKEHQLPSSFFQFLSSFFATNHWLLLCLPPSLPLCSVTSSSALSQQVTSSVSRTVTRGSCIAPQKRALPPRPLCSSLVCSYFKSHNS